jgi:hypothetical protein
MPLVGRGLSANPLPHKNFDFRIKGLDFYAMLSHKFNKVCPLCGHGCMPACHGFVSSLLLVSIRSLLPVDGALAANIGLMRDRLPHLVGEGLIDIHCGSRTKNFAAILIR